MPGDRKQDKHRENTRHTGGPRALAATVGGLATRVAGKRGFAEAGLITGWEAIVGPELAAACWPDRLSFPAGRRNGGTLRIRVAGGMALELQHMEPHLLDRINGHFGYRAVDRISIVNVPPGKGARAAPRRAEGPKSELPPPGMRAAVEQALAKVEDPEIRAVLERLGDAVVKDRRRGGE